MDRQLRDKSPLNDCAWCARCFDNVLDLLDHVEVSHLVGLTEAA